MLEDIASEMRWAMKTLNALIASALMISAVMMPMAAYADTIMQKTSPQGEASLPLNDYYIGVHRPDGSCATVEVFATSYEDAVALVKKERCDFCLLDNMTMYFTSGNPDLVSQGNKTCPTR